MSELRQLAFFVSVYRTRSFRLAAEQMGQSQSTLTKAIQRLEERLDLRLFNRTTRSVEPTESAHQLLSSAELALKAMDGFEQEATLLSSGQMGAVRVGIIALATETVLAPTLAGLSKAHPSIEVDIVVGSADIYSDLANGLCDLAVGDEVNFTSSPYARSLRRTRLKEENLVVVFRKNHPGARHARSVRDLTHFPWAIPSRYFNENHLFRALRSQVPADSLPRYRLTSLTSCLQLSSTSDAITVAPLSVVQELKRSLNIDHDMFDLTTKIKLALFSNAQNALSPAARAFQEAAIQATRGVRAQK